MKSLKEALVHKHIDLPKKYVLEQWDIIETKDNRFWCVLKDLKVIEKIFPTAQTGELAGYDIRDGIMIYYGKNKNHDWVWFWNPLNMYDGLESKEHNKYNIIGVWRQYDRSFTTNLYEFLKASNLEANTQHNPNYKKTYKEK